MNPFLEKPIDIKKMTEDWKTSYPQSCSKEEVDPYTKTRMILMNGTEFEANWFSHHFARHCDDNDLRRELALTRKIEKQQQMKISLLKPKNESILEHTISYEQLAVDLTAELAQRENDCYVKKALDFALLEDFDHLYRYANLLAMEEKTAAEKLVGGYTEIMPGRPTIAHHRCPENNVRRRINTKTAKKETVLSTMIITAAEQQTMNYYMNTANLYPSDIGRKLFEEIGLVEEEHVTQYESLIDCSSTWLEMLLLHEYCECFLYYSCYQTETSSYIKKLWEENLVYEIGHLHKAVELLQKYEGKEWQEVIPDGAFPKPLQLHQNIDYIRDVLKNTVQFTSVKEDYEKVEELPPDASFFQYQKLLHPSEELEPAHLLVDSYLNEKESDYRYEKEEHPIPQLRDRGKDNTQVGRTPKAADSTAFECNH